MRLLFFGTPEFAVPSLERLLAGRHPVVAVVSQPDRRRGRGRRLSASPVAARAEREGVPALRTERVGDPAFVDTLRGYRADLGVVVAFGQFLSRRVRELPALGYLINGHASLLPKFRGAAPVNHAILAGETETGVSVMRVEKEMDGGPVALVRRTAIGPEENAGELAARLAGLTADALAEAVELAARGEIRWTAQDPARASFAPKLTPDDARLDFSQSAEALARRVRALAPRPGAFTTWDGERLRILAAGVEPGGPDRPPGEVEAHAGGRLRIATGSGWLVPRRLQRAGGRPLDVGPFQRGRPLPDGAALGAAASASMSDPS